MRRISSSPGICGSSEGSTSGGNTPPRRASDAIAVEEGSWGGSSPFRVSSRRSFCAMCASDFPRQHEACQRKGGTILRLLRSTVTLPVPPALRRVLDALQAAGGRPYLVGGAV